MISLGDPLSQTASTCLSGFGNLVDSLVGNNPTYSTSVTQPPYNVAANKTQPKKVHTIVVLLLMQIRLAQEISEGPQKLEVRG
jgi:hypothetical protein